MAPYTLPDLPYDYGALAPHISGEIMELHHDKHHQTYVTGLNTVLDQLAEARASESFGAIGGMEKTLAFNLGGHLNHSVFWTNLSPDGGDKPTGDLAAAIDDQFGSFDAFRGQFTANATDVKGSGWSILGWDSVGANLLVFQLYDQQGNVPVCITPILMLDMWEHAFYLQYRNVKADYVKAWWNVVNWADCNERFTTARTRAAGLINPA